MYNAKFVVSCLGLVCPAGVVVFLRCLVPILFCFTANSLLDRNGHGLVGYGFEKSSFWLRLEVRVRGGGAEIEFVAKNRQRRK